MAKDAVGNETKIEIQMAGEFFTCNGLIVEQLNYLEVYTFDKWAEKFIPSFYQGQEFVPNSLKVEKGSTQAPNPLTEADLITVMDNNGIGTDATIHEHIKTV
jgi:DNA topoisomerase III